MQPSPALRAAGSRILVVEDEAIIAEEIQDRLRRLRFKVIGIEASGSRAIEAVERSNPDLVLMDIRLQGTVDGIEAAAEIRRRSGIPVIYLTAHSDVRTLERARETAPLGYILKPIHGRELEVTIEMAIHRHRLERRLRESELRYAATLASIGDAVLATDPEGRITFLNPVAEALLGWTHGAAYGAAAEDVLVLVDEDTREPLESPLKRALAAGETVHLTRPALLIARDGTAIPVDDSAAPIIEASGNMLGVVMAFHDIRDRRLAEDALRTARESLHQAQKMEAIGKLAGGVAHDFNNYLTAINGLCDLLLSNEELPENGAVVVRQILEASRRSAQLTGQLLAFGRQQMLSPKILDLNRLLGGTELLLRRLIGEQIQMEYRPQSDISPIRADPAQIELIMMNLAVNARDAMPDGGKLLIETDEFTLAEESVQAKPAMPAGRYVCLAVSDTGIGMDASTRERLFEPYFTTKDLGKGTGLGLATVYGIVKQSGGHICIYSEPGQGCVFKVYLPAVEGQPAADEPVPTPADPRGDETLLLVEDDAPVRTVFSTALRNLGYQVLVASNSEEAEALFRAHADSIQLVMSDIMMHGSNGIDLAAQLVSSRPALPLLFISGYTNRVIADELRAFTNAAFLQKPFATLDLARKIRAMLDEAAQRT